MEGASTPEPPWAVLMLGAPEESGNGYIAGDMSSSRTWGRGEEDIFVFFCSSIISEQLEGPIGSLGAVLFSGQRVRRGLGLLFPFLGMMDYFSISSSSSCRQPCLSAATPIWQI